MRRVGHTSPRRGAVLAMQVDLGPVQETLLIPAPGARPRDGEPARSAARPASTTAGCAGSTSTDWMARVKATGGPWMFVAEAVLIYLDAAAARRGGIWPWSAALPVPARSSRRELDDADLRRLPPRVRWPGI